MNAPAIYDELIALRPRLLEAGIKPEDLRPFAITEKEHRDMLAYLQPYMHQSTLARHGQFLGFKFVVVETRA